MECLQISLDYRPTIGHSNLGLKNGGCWKWEGCASREIRVLGTECNPLQQQSTGPPSRGGNTCSSPDTNQIKVHQAIAVFWYSRIFSIGSSNPFVCLAECCNSGNIHLKMNYVLEPGESIWPNWGAGMGGKGWKKSTRIFFSPPKFRCAQQRRDHFSGEEAQLTLWQPCLPLCVTYTHRHKSPWVFHLSCPRCYRENLGETTGLSQREWALLRALITHTNTQR